MGIVTNPPSAMGLAALGIRPEAYNPLAGTGALDDSAAMASAISAAKASGLPILLSGYYRVPTLSVQLLDGAADLVIKAVPGSEPIVDALNALGTVRCDFMFTVKSSGLKVYDIAFRNFGQAVVVGSDGLTQTLAGNTWTADIDTIGFYRAKFIGCARAALFENDTYAIDKVRVLGCEFDGRTVDKSTVYALSGFHFETSKIRSAKAIDNDIRFIDTTRAGYGGGGGALRTGLGSGILFGFYDVGTVNATGSQARQDGQDDWYVVGNTVSDMADSRNYVAGVSPQLEAIRVVGTKGARVNNNTVLRVKSDNGLKDCSGIYLKVRYGTCIGNTLIDAGYGSEGSILIKGYTSANADPGGSTITPWTGNYGFAVVVSNNILRTTYNNNTVGIGVQTEDVLVTKNKLYGFGGTANTYVPIYTRGAQADRIHIINNEIYDTVGYTAIRLTHGGNDCVVTDNTINNILGNAGGGTIARIIGISYEYVDSTYVGTLSFSNLKIAGNRISGLAGSDRRAISVYNAVAGAVPGNVVVNDNEVLSAVEIGVIVGSSTSPVATAIPEQKLIGNDLRLAATPYTTTGTGPTALIARDNLGYLFWKIASSVGNVPAGTYVDKAFTVSGATYGDLIEWAVDNTLSGLSVKPLGFTGGSAYSLRFSNDNVGATVTGSISATVMTVTAVPSFGPPLKVGDTITGTGVTTCTITSLGTGTGGTGTYNVSVSQTAASTALYANAISVGSRNYSFKAEKRVA